MPHELDLIFTLAGALGAALVLGFITDRLRLSPIVGYLLAGIAVGPHTPGFVATPAIAEQFAELGVILLMFGVGLHFHVKELLAVRRIAIPGAILQIAVATGLGVLVTRWTGWSLQAGIVFGLAISVASTVVLLRVLTDNDALHTRTGHIAVGWLVVEDLFTVLVLVVLPAMAPAAGADAAGSTSTWQVLLAIGVAVAKVAALVTFTLVVGQRVIPRLLGYVAKRRSRELFTLSVLAIALGIAIGAASLFGVSMALGAFLAGTVVGQSSFSTRAAAEALPMRDAFAVLFFVSVGMLLDPASLLQSWPLVLATLAVVLVGKPLAAFAAVVGLRYPVSMAVPVAVALAQIGEFSFIVAALARHLGILPEGAQQVLVAAAIVSITLNPGLYRLAAPLSRWLSPRAKEPPGRGPDDADAAAHRAIVIGYGPVGRTVTRLLADNGVVPSIIELNHETVERLRQEGLHAIYGDAAQAAVLQAAGLATARTLIFAASGTPSDAVVRAAKALNPQLRILARSGYASEAKAAREAGADVVVAAEAEVALAMAEHILTELGATSEQLDRARDRVRADLVAPDEARGAT